MQDTKKFSTARLSEINFIVIMIGVTFMIIGISSIFGITVINSMFVLAISLSGTFFVLADIVQYLSDTYSSNNSKVIKSLKFFKSISLALSILSLLTLPFLNIQVKNAEILATAFSIIAIGLTIINLSLNNKRMQNEILERVITGWEKSDEQTEKAIKQAEDANALVERVLDILEKEKLK
ncbi:hypothetical protein NY607_12480 [Lysinibacillus sp. A4]|uniref:hypothetical protein n=1 Tax=Lysinibacillus sp. A4 TaxID=2976269 RepID=UPI0021758BA6|nr:hypothetical protein [Lysinibacillus sp. A4]MCS5501943.1 hypothetical protein [Lysinibacillus sp. A4]